jgi:hypothetical protein
MLSFSLSVLPGPEFFIIIKRAFLLAVGRFLEPWLSSAADTTLELQNGASRNATHEAIGLFKALFLRYIGTNTSVGEQERLTASGLLQQHLAP